MQQRSAKREEKWKQSTQTQHTRKDKTPAPDSKQMWMNLFFLSAFERNMPHRRYLLPFHSPYNIYTRWKITNETAIRIGTKAAKFQIYSNQNAREMMKKGMKIISEWGKWQKTTALFRALLLVRCISLKSNVDCSNHSGPGFPLIFVCCCWNSISMSHEIIEFFVTMNRCDSCQQQSLDFFFYQSRNHWYKYQRKPQLSTVRTCDDFVAYVVSFLRFRKVCTSFIEFLPFTYLNFKAVFISCFVRWRNEGAPLISVR